MFLQGIPSVFSACSTGHFRVFRVFRGPLSCLSRILRAASVTFACSAGRFRVFRLFRGLCGPFPRISPTKGYPNVHGLRYS